MSNIYIQEPPTEGKVLLTTTAGELDIELWSKEAPKACRNFVQLCLENYFDGTLFHRVIPGFIVQGGDPTSTGTGGESIYGKPFKDEFHTRLRFVRRGLVAMANGGPHDNGSQFFFTLASAKELQNKNTIFGKITGDTLYNVSRFEEGEIGRNDRPEFPHKLTKTQVLNNPFKDIVPRLKIQNEISKEKKKKKKGTKNFKLLSFGDEAYEDEEASVQADSELPKGKSAHDIAKDPKLSKKVVEIEKPNEDIVQRIHDKLNKKSEQVQSSSDDSDNDNDKEERHHRTSTSEDSNRIKKQYDSEGESRKRNRSGEERSREGNNGRNRERSRNDRDGLPTDRRKEDGDNYHHGNRNRHRSDDDQRRGSDGVTKKERRDSLQSPTKERESKKERGKLSGDRRDSSKNSHEDRRGDGDRRYSEEERIDKRNLNPRDYESRRHRSPEDKRLRKDEHKEDNGGEKSSKKRKSENSQDGSNIVDEKHVKDPNVDKNLNDEVQHEKKDNKKENSHKDKHKVPESTEKEHEKKKKKETDDCHKEIQNEIPSDQQRKKSKKDRDRTPSPDEHPKKKKRHSSNNENNEESKPRHEKNKEKSGKENVDHKLTENVDRKLKENVDHELKENVDHKLKEKDEDAKKLRSETKAEINKLKRELSGKTKNKEQKPIAEPLTEEKVSITVKEFNIDVEKYVKRKEKILVKGKAREQQTFDILKKFTQKVRDMNAKLSLDLPDDEDETEEDLNDDSWMVSKLQFEENAPVVAKDASTKDDHWYDITDPRNAINKSRREKPVKEKSSTKDSHHRERKKHH